MLPVLIIIVNSSNVCVFCKILLGNKLDLHKALCYITLYIDVAYSDDN